MHAKQCPLTGLSKFQNNLIELPNFLSGGEFKLGKESERNAAKQRSDKVEHLVSVDKIH